MFFLSFLETKNKQKPLPPSPRKSKMKLSLAPPHLSLNPAVLERHLLHNRAVALRFVYCLWETSTGHRFIVFFSLWCFVVALLEHTVCSFYFYIRMYENILFILMIIYLSCLNFPLYLQYCKNKKESAA